MIDGALEELDSKATAPSALLTLSIPEIEDGALPGSLNPSATSRALSLEAFVFLPPRSPRGIRWPRLLFAIKARSCSKPPQQEKGKDKEKTEKGKNTRDREKPRQRKGSKPTATSPRWQPQRELRLITTKTCGISTRTFLEPKPFK